MKVLVNAISARKGGIVTYTSNLGHALEGRGIDAVFALSAKFPAELRGNILRLAASEYAAPWRLLWEQSIWRWIVSRNAPDILFSSANFALLWSPVPQVLLVREGGLFDPFYLVNIAPSQGVRGIAMRVLRRKSMLLSADHADRVITPTNAMRDLILQWAPHLERKISVNLYGTLVDVFKPAHQPRPWRHGGELRLLYVSVYYPHKNPGSLCRAVEAMNRSNLKSSATITMTADEIANSRGGVIDALVVERAVATGQIRLGHHAYDRLPALYHDHDVFVFPSVSETFGHPLVEAMGCAIPIVAADTVVNREICGDAAIYFEPFSAASLVDAIRRLDQDPALRRSLGETGRKRVLAKFTWDSHVDRLLQIFDGTRRRGASAHEAA